VTLNLLKLCVGCDTVEELKVWRRQSASAGQPWILRTRQTPRLVDRLLDGGSLYRVFKGDILCRQLILAVDSCEAAGERWCEITLDETIVLTEPTPRRAFQGWRYLELADSPMDINVGDSDGYLPPELARRLREAGAW
jgi:hypothetical protein